MKDDRGSRSPDSSYLGCQSHDFGYGDREGIGDSRIGQRLSGYRTPSSAWFQSFRTTCDQEAAHFIEESQGATSVRTGAYRMDDGAMETSSLVGRVQVPDVLFRWSEVRLAFQGPSLSPSLPDSDCETRGRIRNGVELFPCWGARGLS